MRRHVTGSLLLLFLAAALLIGTAPAWVSVFIYRPAPLRDARPRSWGLPDAQEVTIVSGARERLACWWIPPPRPRDPVVLILHGRSANVSTRAPVAARLHTDGFGVLLVDYRGYGRSTGRPDEAGLVQDAVAAYDWLRTREIDARRIVVLGQSLGDAPAARLGVVREIGALALVSPFTSLPGALLDRLGLPAVATPLWWRNRFDVEADVRRLRAPVLLVVSPADGLVPYGNSRRVAASARHPVWLEAPGRRHDGLLSAVAQTGALSRALEALVSDP